MANDIEIDGARYIIGRLPPRRALKLQNRLVRVLGPAVVPLISAVPVDGEGKADLGSVDLDAVSSGLQGLMAQLTPQEQDGIMEELFSVVQVAGGDKVAPVMAIFDAHFEGRLVAVWKLMWACLQEQFGGFFGLLAAAARLAAAGTRSKGSTTSARSGPSGASS